MAVTTIEDTEGALPREAARPRDTVLPRGIVPHLEAVHLRVAMVALRHEDMLVLPRVAMLVLLPVSPCGVPIPPHVVGMEAVVVPGAPQDMVVRPGACQGMDMGRVVEDINLEILLS